MNSAKKGIIPVFVPHMGCPHDCVFCNQKKITGQAEPFEPDGLKAYIQTYLSTMSGRRHPIELAFYGGSFTGIEASLQIEYLSIARQFLLDGHIHGIRLSTRPDYIDDEVLNRLKAYGVKTVELGVQTMDSEVLKLSRRGHTLEDVHKASRLIREAGLTLGLQMMLGLPGDTLDKALLTAKGLIALKPDFVRIYPTVVLRETELEDLYESGNYMPMDVETAVDWLAVLMPTFSGAGIPVIRVGLQATDELTSGENTVAGAYHPSLRQLARSRIILNRIEEVLDSHQNCSNPPVAAKISVCGREWTELRGVKAVNMQRLKERYPHMNLEYLRDDTVPRHTCLIRISIGGNDEITTIKFD